MLVIWFFKLNQERRLRNLNETNQNSTNEDLRAKRHSNINNTMNVNSIDSNYFVREIPIQQQQPATIVPTDRNYSEVI